MPKPKHLTDVDQFLKMFYDSMIRTEYKKDFAAEKVLFKTKLAEYRQRQTSKEQGSGDVERQAEGEGEGEEDVDVVAEEPKPPVSVNVHCSTTCRLWNAQTEDFHAQVRKRANDAHKEAVAEWEEKKKQLPPKSAEHYDRYVSNFYNLRHFFSLILLQCSALRELYQLVKQFAEGVHEEFGMAVSMLLCGPINPSNDAIDVRR